MLFEQIQKDQLTARKNRETEKASLLTIIISDVKTLAKNEMREPVDTDIITIINRLMKKCRENVDIYTTSNRQDKLDEVNREIAVMEAYLPKQATADEIAAEILNIVQANDLKKEPQSVKVLMGGLKTKFGSALNGAVAKGQVDAFLKS